MSLPVYVPSFTTNPLGWVFLGAVGFATYKMGKKSGLQSSEEKLDKPSLGDRVVKETMKSAYKAKKCAQDSLGKASEKYSSMWKEVKTETQA